MASPRVNILSPKNTTITDSLSVTVTWSYLDQDSNAQKSFRVYVEDTNLNESILGRPVFIYDSGEVVQAETRFDIPVPFPETGEFRLVLAARDSNGEQSNSAVEIFRMDAVGATARSSVTINQDLLTVETQTPTIAWTFFDPSGYVQSGYQIILTRASGEEVYNSGIVASGNTQHTIPEDQQIPVQGTQVFNVILNVWNSNQSFNDPATVDPPAQDTGILTISIIVPVISRFAVNGDELGIGETFSTTVQLDMNVANAMEMAFKDAVETAPNVHTPPDFLEPNWIPYSESHVYTIQSNIPDGNLSGTKVHIYAVFRTGGTLRESTPISRAITIKDESAITPVITSRSPSANSANNPINSKVSVRFNKRMLKSSVEAGFNMRMVTSNINLSGKFEWNELPQGDELVFTPSQLNFQKQYEVRISTYYDPVTNTNQQPRDSFGLPLNNTSWSFTVESDSDRTAPDSPFVSIAGGAPSVTSPDVELTLSATGDPTEMNIYGDVVTVTGWIPYITSYRVNLTPTSGNKIVYVVFRDRSGNVSRVASDNILFKDINPPPTPTLELVRPSDVIYLPYTDLQGACVPNITIRLYRDGYDDHVYETKTDGFGFYRAVEIPLLVGVNTLYARSVDLNGNLSEKSSFVSFEFRVPDRTSPRIVTSESIDSTHFRVYFSEEMELSSVTSLSSYYIDGLTISDIQVPEEPFSDLNGVSVYEVVFTSSSQRNQAYVIHTKNIKDTFGNNLDENYNTSIFIGIPAIDLVRPMVLSAYPTSNTSIYVEFSEPVIVTGDRTALNTLNYKIEGLGVSDARATDKPNVLELITGFQSQRLYELEVTGVYDMAGNVIGASNNTAFFQGVPLPGSGGFRALRTVPVDNTTVHIEFSDVLDFESALDANNYEIVGLKVDGVFKVNDFTVGLKTSPQAGISYIITMTNIQSAAKEFAVQ